MECILHWLNFCKLLDKVICSGLQVDLENMFLSWWKSLLLGYKHSSHLFSTEKIAGFFLPVIINYWNKIVPLQFYRCSIAKDGLCFWFITLHPFDFLKHNTTSKLKCIRYWETLSSGFTFYYYDYIPLHLFIVLLVAMLYRSFCWDYCSWL